MYESFYGLREKPFNLNPDSEYLYMSPVHENAYTHMVYAISENKGFVIITGDIGSGKTTVINYLLNQIPQDIHVGLVNNTHLSPTQFIKTMCREFELEVENFDKASMIGRFQDFLLEQLYNDKRVVLIVDEAQNLMPKTLEEIRMLSNLESEKSHLLQVILVGQPELKYKLQRPGLRQFAQRVTVHCHIDALNPDEVEEYIRYRLQIGGSNNHNLFEADALASIAEYSKGIPRLINVLCDTALVYGFAESKETIDRQIIEDVVRERAAGGILEIDGSAVQNKVAGSSANERYNGNGLEPLLDRMNLMEKKIEYLEKSFRNIDNTIERLINRKDEKDLLMIELFKLLKNSMENRMNTLLQLSDRQKKDSMKLN